MWKGIIDMADRMFSEEQIFIAKMLMDLESELNNKINFTIQENFLRKPLEDKVLKVQLECLEDSIEYVVKEKLSLMKNILKE